MPTPERRLTAARPRALVCAALALLAGCGTDVDIEYASLEGQSINGITVLDELWSDAFAAERYHIDGGLLALFSGGIARLRHEFPESCPTIMVAGTALDGTGDLWREMGADGRAEDLETLSAALASVVR